MATSFTFQLGELQGSQTDKFLDLVWGGSAVPLSQFATRVIGMDKGELYARSSLEQEPLEAGVRYHLRGRGLYQVGVSIKLGVGANQHETQGFWYQDGTLTPLAAGVFHEAAEAEWGRLLREVRAADKVRQTA